jgi:hypothetical protein
MKDRTNEESSDPVPGSLPDDARRPGCGSTRRRRKHGEAQDETENGWSRCSIPRTCKWPGNASGQQWRSAGDRRDDHREFPAFARQHWERIRAQLREGIYHPAPVRRVFIPKPDGSQRPLGVPTVLDRVIQQAIAQVLTPLYDGEFSDTVTDSAQAATPIKRCAEWRKAGSKGAATRGLRSEGVLRHREPRPPARAVAPKIGSGKLLRLIGRYLRAGVVLPDGTREATPLGVPQGGPCHRC